MLAYHNNEDLKQSALAEMAMHREMDNLVKGQYWENGKGCAVGCLIKSGDHAEYETRFGIPRVLARLEDGIFEGLPMEHAKQWPERFLGAIKTGSDLSMVFYHFMYWLLVDKNDGVLQYAKTDRSKESIKKVAALFQRKINGEDIKAKDWRAADAAAADAAAAAAYAAYAAAAYAADAYAADAAAYAAADAYARIKQADKLVELLINAPYADGGQ